MDQTTKRYYYFASDMHLGNGSPEESRERERRVVEWLGQIAADATELFLVGDIFDFWYEYKRVVPRGFVRTLGALAALADKGVKIHYFAGNHDMTRIGDVIRKNPNRAKIAMAMLATMRGIPQVFYGEEMMLCSADLSQGHGGLRIDFPGGWAGDKTNLLTAEGRKGMHKELFDFSARLLNWRKSKPVIHNGETMHFMTRDNTYAYFRYDDTDAVFVYINNSGKTVNIPWANYAEVASELKSGRNVLTAEAIEVDGSTKVGPREVLVVEYTR